MKGKINTLWAIVIFFLIAGKLPTVGQEVIAVIQSPHVKLLDIETGDIIDPSFIDMTSLDPGTPKALCQVGEEIWITDQLDDRIYRYDSNGNYLSTITGAFDNIKGLAVVNGTEVWVTNAGSNNGAPGDAIIRFDLDGNILGNFSTPESAFDIIDNGAGEVYISYIDAMSHIERRDYDGNVLGNIVNPGILNFVQQIQITASEDLLVGTFSSPSGVYIFDIATGNQLEYWSGSGLRGVAETANGSILWTNSSGVYRLNPSTGVSTLLSSGSAQFFGFLGACDTPPTPTGDSEQYVEEGSTLEDLVVSPPNVTWFATEEDALAGENPLDPTTLLEDETTYYAVNIVGGCLSEPFAVTVYFIVGTEDFTVSGLKVYPNPVENVLYLQADIMINRIVVANILGQHVMEINSNTNQLAINLSELQQGLYFVQIHAEKSSETVKIVKQ